VQQNSPLPMQTERKEQNLEAQRRLDSKKVCIQQLQGWIRQHVRVETSIQLQILAIKS